MEATTNKLHQVKGTSEWWWWWWQWCCQHHRLTFPSTALTWDSSHFIFIDVAAAITIVDFSHAQHNAWFFFLSLGFFSFTQCVWVCSRSIIAILFGSVHRMRFAIEIARSPLASCSHTHDFYAKRNNNNRNEKRIRERWSWWWWLLTVLPTSSCLGSELFFSWNLNLCLRLLCAIWISNDFVSLAFCRFGLGRCLFCPLSDSSQLFHWRKIQFYR